MSPAVRRARTARLQLALGAFASAALWGGAAAVTLFVVAAGLDVVVGLPRGVRSLVMPVAALAFAAAFAAAVWRSRHVRSLPRVALWIEERLPSLGYSLVTCVEMGRLAPAQLEHMVAAQQWEADLARATARAVMRPLALVVTALVALALLPGGAVSRVASPAPGDVLDRLDPAGSGTPGRSLLQPLTATIRPPAYAALPEEVIEEPSLVAALRGGRVTLGGRGNHERVGALVGGREIRAAPGPGRDRWQLAIAVPEAPVAVQLSDGVHRRLVTLEPLPDEEPTVVLTLPLRDTVMRAARGQLSLAAEARDDLGLARATFEYIVSSGSGELFRFRTGTVGGGALGGARSRSLTATLSLDALALGPGDVVHLRAVAWDANDVGGPGMGSSETRTIRIARADEYDTLAVEGAPPPDVDADAVSQRMLIIQTERLEARRRRLTRDSLVAESRAIAQRQNMLRRRVAEIVFMRLGVESDAEHSHGPGDGHEHTEEELAAFLTPDRLMQQAGAAISAHGLAEMGGHGHDESPILAINEPLLEAYNHMWEASGALEIGEPARALPPMRRALEALQRAREAERYYARARAPRVVVDIARVRLAAPQSVSPASRSMRATAASPRQLLAVRLMSAVERLVTAPSDAVDSLMLVRLDALRHVPAAAPPLAEAVAALRGGRDATDALVTARRAIEGTAHEMPGDGRWRGW